MLSISEGKTKNDQRLSVGQPFPDRVFLSSSHRFRGSYIRLVRTLEYYCNGCLGIYNLATHFIYYFVW